MDDTIPSNISRIHNLLKILAEEGPDIGYALLRTLSPVLLKGLSEMCYNLLCGNLPLQPDSEDQCYFRRFKPLLRCLANGHSSKAAVRQCLTRKGCYEPLRRLAQLTLRYFKRQHQTKHEHTSGRPLQLDTGRASAKTFGVATGQSTTQRQGTAFTAQSDESDSN